MSGVAFVCAVSFAELISNIVKYMTRRSLKRVNETAKRNLAFGYGNCCELLSARINVNIRRILKIFPFTVPTNNTRPGRRLGLNALSLFRLRCVRSKKRVSSDQAF